MQVASRILISLVCVEKAQMHANWWYPTLVLAWGLADFIRYSYYTLSLVTDGETWYPIKWLRYTAFVPLYPIGTACELYLLCSTWRAWKSSGSGWNYGLFALLVIWLPGLLYMYVHMLKQRRHHLSPPKAARTTKRS